RRLNARGEPTACDAIFSRPQLVEFFSVKVDIRVLSSKGGDVRAFLGPQRHDAGRIVKGADAGVGIELGTFCRDAPVRVGEHDVAARDYPVRHRVQVDVVRKKLEPRSLDGGLTNQVQVITDLFELPARKIRDAEWQIVARRGLRRRLSADGGGPEA